MEWVTLALEGMRILSGTCPSTASIGCQSIRMRIRQLRLSRTQTQAVWDWHIDLYLPWAWFLESMYA